MTAYELEMVVCEGLVFGFLALGVYVAFQWGRYPDLTPDGSFVFGACCYAKLVMLGFPPIVGVLMSFLAGSCAGCCTAAVNRLIKIPAVVSGLLVSSVLYSVNWLLLAKPNQFLDAKYTLAGDVNGEKAVLILLMWLLFLGVAVVFVLAAFGGSYWGLRLRALGENPLLARDIRASATGYTFLTLIVANGLVGFSGALFSQRSYSVDINMGVGITIVGLVGMLLGSLLARNRKRLWIIITCVIGGAVVAKFATYTALEAGMPAESFRMLTGVVLVLVFCLVRTSATDVLRGLKWN